MSGSTTPPPGTETCGCCEGTHALTPGVIENRPGLSEVAYRSGAHSDFLASMLTALVDKDRPTLGRLRTRASDDPTIAVLDAFAVACDVLTFYSERLANESYLRTATERTSLQELGKLVGFRLSPGVAAETWLAFSLEHPTPTPAAMPKDPGLIPPVVPTAVTLPERLRVQSVPGPGETAQTFETVEEIEARPEWNVLPVVATKFYPPRFGRRDAWLAGSNLNLQAGEAMLFASQDLVNDRWDVRLLTDIDTVGEQTHVTWEWGLGSFKPFNNPADAPDAFILRKRFAVFGHNAPVWLAMNDEFKTGYVLQFKDEVKPPKVADPEWAHFKALGAGLIVDLDGAHPDVVRGSWIVLSQEGTGFYRELYQVVNRAELSRSEFGISGKVTRLTLKGENHDFGSPRQVTVMGVAEPVTLTEAPDDSLVDTETLVVTGDASAMAAGRSVILAGTVSGVHKSEVVTIRAVSAQPGDRTKLELTAAPTHPYDRATAVIFGNVAHATHGETVQQILGSGDARTPFQTYQLRQGPLTFVPADNPHGAESTLEVQVDGLQWKERVSAYQAGTTDRIFTTRDEPDGTESVVFGDGVNGIRPATGSNNVRTRYRKGIGAAGNLRVDQLSQALDRPLGLKAVTNPLAAVGGVDAEPQSQARKSIPRRVRTLGRAVSLLDYADFALAFPGIDKASVVVLPLREGRSIVVSVAREDGSAPDPTTIERLGKAMTLGGDRYVRTHVLPARLAWFRLGPRIKVDPDRERDTVFAAVEATLRATFSAQARDIGSAVHASRVIAVAASVVGVVAVDLDSLHRSTAISLQSRLVAEPAGVGPAGTPIAAELLALAAGPFDELLEMT